MQGAAAGAGAAALEQATGDPLLTAANLLPPFNVGGTAASANRRRVWRTRFLPEHVYEYYARQNATTLNSLPPGHLRYREIPPEFIDVMPLDKALLAEDTGAGQPSAHTTGSFGRVTSVFKVISSEDGCSYALRRVDNVRSTPAILEAAVQQWAQAVHPAVIPLRRAFHPTQVRGGPPPNALFFLHDYYPGAKNLRELYLDSWGPLIPEPTLWSYICELVAGLRAVHDADLSFRGLRPAHILVTGQGRLRFASAGVMDVLESDVPKSLSEMRALDVVSLGQLILHLAVRDRTAHYPANLANSLETVKRTYSPAVVQLVVVLLGKNSMPIHEVCRLLAPQLLAELDSCWDHNDALEHLLGREADNGRLLRLLLKFGFVNERPEYEGDANWAETGDRYLLKLFRDFVFHQVTDEGRPVLDVAHVLDALHNLDIGNQMKVLLSSRDGASVLVSSYATLRAALDGAFNDLKNASRKDTAAAGAAGAQEEADGAAAGDADLPAWMRRPKIPAVVRSRTGTAIRRNNRAALGRGGMGMGAMGMGIGLGGMGGPLGAAGMGPMAGMMPHAFGLMGSDLMAAAGAMPFDPSNLAAAAGMAAAGMAAAGMAAAEGAGDGTEGLADGMAAMGMGDGVYGGADGSYTPYYAQGEGEDGQGGGMVGDDGSGGQYAVGPNGEPLQGGYDGSGGVPMGGGAEYEGADGGYAAGQEGYQGQGGYDGAGAGGQGYDPSTAGEYTPSGGYIAADGSYVPASQAGQAMQSWDANGDQSGSSAEAAAAAFNVHAQEFRPTWAS